MKEPYGLAGNTSITPMESLRSQLQHIVDVRRSGVWPSVPEDWRFQCIEDLVLQHGREYRPVPVSWTPIAKACFHESFTRATKRRSPWVYVEGYALRADGIGIAVQHAWLTRPDAPGLAYDTAWDNNEKAVYLGIPVTARYIRQCHKASEGKWYSAFDTWWMRHPILSGAHRIEDVSPAMLAD